MNDFCFLDPQIGTVGHNIKKHQVHIIFACAKMKPFGNLFKGRFQKAVMSPGFLLQQIFQNSDAFLYRERASMGQLLWKFSQNSGFCKFVKLISAKIKMKFRFSYYLTCVFYVGLHIGDNIVSSWKAFRNKMRHPVFFQKWDQAGLRFHVVKSGVTESCGSDHVSLFFNGMRNLKKRPAFFFIR